MLDEKRRYERYNILKNWVNENSITTLTNLDELEEFTSNTFNDEDKEMIQRILQYKAQEETKKNEEIKKQIINFIKYNNIEKIEDYTNNPDLNIKVEGYDDDLTLFKSILEEVNKEKKNIKKMKIPSIYDKNSKKEIEQEQKEQERLKREQEEKEELEKQNKEMNINMPFYIFLGLILHFINFKEKTEEQDIIVILKNDNKLFKRDIIYEVVIDNLKMMIVNNIKSTESKNKNIEKIVNDILYINSIYRLLNTNVNTNFDVVYIDGTIQSISQDNSGLIKYKLTSNLYRDIILCYNIIVKCNDDVIVKNACKIFSTKIRAFCYISAFIKVLPFKDLKNDIDDFLLIITDNELKNKFKTAFDIIIDIYKDINYVNNHLSKFVFTKRLNLATTSNILIDLDFMINKLFKYSINPILKHNIESHFNITLSDNDYYTEQYILNNFIIINADDVVNRNDNITLNMMHDFSILYVTPVSVFSQLEVSDLVKDTTYYSSKLLKYDFFTGGNNTNISLMDKMNEEILKNSLIDISIPYEKKINIHTGENDISVKLKKELHRNVTITSFITTLLFFVLAIILVSILVYMVYRWFNERIVKDENALKNNKGLNFIIPSFIHNRQNSNRNNMRKHIRTSYYV